MASVIVGHREREQSQGLGVFQQSPPGYGIHLQTRRDFWRANRIHVGRHCHSVHGKRRRRNQLRGCGDSTIIPLTGAVWGAAGKAASGSHFAAASPAGRIQTLVTVGWRRRPARNHDLLRRAASVRGRRASRIVVDPQPCPSRPMDRLFLQRDTLRSLPMVRARVLINGLLLRLRPWFAWRAGSPQKASASGRCEDRKHHTASARTDDANEATEPISLCSPSQEQ